MVVIVFYTIQCGQRKNKFSINFRKNSGFGLFFIVLGHIFQIAGYSSLSFNTVAMHSISISQPGRQTDACTQTGSS